MSRFFPVIFSTFGVVCVYLFATGVTVEQDLTHSGLAERIMAPFRDFSASSAVLLVTAVVAFFLALAFRIRSGVYSNQNETTWGRVLQAAFSSAVAIVAAVILVLFLSATGWLPGMSSGNTALGALFFIGILETALATVLAVTLLFCKKSAVHYVSTLVIHVIELVILSLVFWSGYSA
jgi:hypothetical protein